MKNNSPKNNSSKKIKWIAFLIRWWSVGAMYFFIGWGTQLGNYDRPIDMIFILGGAIGLFNSFIVNPALKMLFDIGDQKKYMERTIMEKVSFRLQNVVASMFIVYLVTIIYDVINRGAIVIFSLPVETVVLPGEPILFAVFYMMIYTVLTQLIKNVKNRSVNS
ncbi:hypothetical protein [Fusibacter bizertensis]